MQTYIFLTNYYMPVPGATGLCVHQLAKELAKTNIVYTVCYKGVKTVHELDGVKIINMDIPSYLQECVTKNKVEKSIKQLESIIRKAFYITRYPLRSMGLVNSYIREVKKIMDRNDQVKIVASFTPLEAVLAAYELKKKYPKKVQIIYYSTDTLSNEDGDEGILPKEYRRRCGIRWEKKMFEIYDKIMIMECHKNHYLSEEYRNYSKKISIVNFPLLEKRKSEVYDKAKQNKILLVYAGTLYKKLRNPQYLCDCLVNISSKIEIKVDFLGGGDCREIIERASQQSEEKILYHGMQPHEIALEYINNADVLLSIGNAESPMAPSKIYEYMATGKPIIHIYTYEKDPCLDPLKKYGNALLIKEGEQKGDIEIENFIKQRKYMKYEEVEKKFITSTPEYTTDILESM